MERQVLKDLDKIIEGTDLNMLLKSKRAYNNILVLIDEAAKKQNIPAILANVERIKALSHHFMNEALRLDGRIRHMQKENQLMQIEIADLMDEIFLIISESKGREPYLRAKEIVDGFIGKI